VTAPAERADAVVAAVRELELDALLVSRLVDLRWLCGFTGSSGAAVVGPSDRRFVTDFRYLTQAREQVGEGWSHEIAQKLLEQIAGGMRAPARLGFDDTHLTVKDHARLGELAPEGVELVPTGGVIADLRAVKDAGELERIRAAAALADDALGEVLDRGLVGRTEREVALDLEVAMRRRGAQGASFAPIVAAAEHGALPHAEPRDVAIPAGTLVVVDWGAQLDGYASDCTRTYATGRLDPEARAVYDLVERAQSRALAAVRPGPSGKEVDAVAREVIEAAGHGERFGHGLGHGVGMEVHEAPRLSRQAGDDPLQAGHVVTVEPGVYLPGRVGVRIEDLVAITADGHEVLSGLPKALQVV